MCKIEVREAKQIAIKLRIEQLNETRRIKEEAKAATQTEAPAATTTPAPKNSGAFGNVFAPTNLSDEEEATPEPAPKAGNGAFGNVFDPNNLNSE